MACNYCKTDFYVKVKIHSKPLFPPLTAEGELRQKLQELTGEEFLKIQPEFCPMCGERKKTMDNWISVKDKLPETDYTNTKNYSVLLYIPQREGCDQHGIYLGKIRPIKETDGRENFLGIPIKATDWTIWGWSYYEHPIVTHWQPLPEPPKDNPELLKGGVDNG